MFLMTESCDDEDLADEFEDTEIGQFQQSTRLRGLDQVFIMTATTNTIAINTITRTKKTSNYILKRRREGEYESTRHSNNFAYAGKYFHDDRTMLQYDMGNGSTTTSRIER